MIGGILLIGISVVSGLLAGKLVAWVIEKKYGKQPF